MWKGEVIAQLEQDWEATKHQRKTWYNLLHKLRKECRSVLDVGCGVGFDLPIYHELAYGYHGVDGSVAMIEKARSKSFVSDNFTVLNITKPFLLNLTFDLVASHDVLIHVDRWRAALDEMWKVTDKVMLIRLAYSTDKVALHTCDINRGFLNIWFNWAAFSHALWELSPPPSSVEVIPVEEEEKSGAAVKHQIFLVRKYVD